MTLGLDAPSRADGVNQRVLQSLQPTPLTGFLQQHLHLFGVSLFPPQHGQGQHRSRITCRFSGQLAVESCRLFAAAVLPFEIR